MIFKGKYLHFTAVPTGFKTIFSNQRGVLNEFRKSVFSDARHVFSNYPLKIEYFIT